MRTVVYAAQAPDILIIGATEADVHAHIGLLVLQRLLSTEQLDALVTAGVQLHELVNGGTLDEPTPIVSVSGAVGNLPAFPTGVGPTLCAHWRHRGDEIISTEGETVLIVSGGDTSDQDARLASWLVAVANALRGL